MNRPRPGFPSLALLLVALLWTPGIAAAEAPATSAAARSQSILGESKTLWDIFLEGGWCMWPILGSSVIGMAFYLERVIELRRKRHVPPGFDKDIVHVVDTRGVDAGLALCLEKQSSLSRVLYAALLRYGTSRQEMEAAVRDEDARLHYDLRRNGRVIGLMCVQAPLWGLLGTVLGLIEAFSQAAAAGAAGTTEQFAEGLGVALIAAAFGLLVLIPLTVLYFHANGMADDITREIEERAIDSIVTIDRKARRSIRLIEDIEENLETKEMAAAKPAPDLDAEFDDPDLEKSIKTSVTTPAHMPVVTPPANTPVPEVKADVQAPRQIANPDSERK